jgi:hypothetical protein
VHDHHRLARADGGGVRERDLREEQVRHRLQVQPRVRGDVVSPRLRQLALADLQRAGDHRVAVRGLEAELDQLADDDVEHRDPLERGGRGPVGGVLERAGGDLLEALVLREGRRHSPCDATGARAGSPAADPTTRR